MHPGWAWTPRPDTTSPFGSRRTFKLIDTVWYLQSCFWYALDQHEHHGVEADPWREGTLLPDLLGLRVCGRWAIPRVREQLPRVLSAELRTRLPFDREAEGGAEGLAPAAAAAIGRVALGVDEASRWARRAAVVVGCERWRGPRVREVLELPRRTATRHLATGAPPELLEAVRLQLAFQASMSQRGGA